MERKEGGVTEIGQTRREQALCLDRSKLCCWSKERLQLNRGLEPHSSGTLSPAAASTTTSPRKTDIVALSQDPCAKRTKNGSNGPKCCPQSGFVCKKDKKWSKWSKWSKVLPSVRIRVQKRQKMVQMVQMVQSVALSQNVCKKDKKFRLNEKFEYCYVAFFGKSCA